MSEREVAVYPQVVEPSQDSDVVLSVKGVSKKFCRDLKRSLMYGVQDIAGELLGLRGDGNDRLRKKEFWALQDVSFELRRGEALGLVGKNGSGKSTLLRIIAGLIKPDQGEVIVNGRVAPLIALGAGFNPVLTGRENIYANMSILGLTREEIDERFDEVVEFAEIGEAIDSPVQTYSSGMAARLGFASAIYTKPDILLIDEVLAVGDSQFRSKCFRQLHDLRECGTSFILVSHDSHTVLTVCESSVYLKQGSVIFTGRTDTTIKKYEEDLFSVKDTSEETYSLRKKALEEFILNISSVSFKDKENRVVKRLISGDEVYISIECVVLEKIENVSFSIIIKGLAEGGETVLILNSSGDGKSINLSAGKHEIQIHFPYLGLKLGHYFLDAYSKKDGLYALDSIKSFKFKVGSKDSISRGLYYQPRIWKQIEI